VELPFGLYGLLTVPLAFALFQMMFASITPLLMTGAYAERVKWRAFLTLTVFWEILIFYPVAHWMVCGHVCLFVLIAHCFCHVLHEFCYSGEVVGSKKWELLILPEELVRYV
jgi:hypothetical protein